jgi:hypothetical protein
VGCAAGGAVAGVEPCPPESWLGVVTGVVSGVVTGVVPGVLFGAVMKPLGSVEVVLAPVAADDDAFASWSK